MLKFNFFVSLVFFTYFWILLFNYFSGCWLVVHWAVLASKELLRVRYWGSIRYRSGMQVNFLLSLFPSSNMHQIVILLKVFSRWWTVRSPRYAIFLYQFHVSVIHSSGLPWGTTFVASGIILRVATAPAHIYAEKLFARRLHATNFIHQAVLKVGVIYRILC